MIKKKRAFLILLFLLIVATVAITFTLIFMGRVTQADKASFRSAWPDEIERAWVGPEYWANRLQDWRIFDGRLECVEGSTEKPARTVHLLTRRLGEEKGGFMLKVRTGLIEPPSGAPEDAASGFLIGAGPELDYRAAALVHHSPGPGGGLVAAMDGSGRAVFRDMTTEGMPLLVFDNSSTNPLPNEVDIQLTGKPNNDAYELELSVHDVATGNITSRMILKEVTPDRLIGNIALVSHPGTSPQPVRFWFRDWQVNGKKIEVHEDRLCGPVLCTQYTLSHGILKMTAQMMPLGPKDTQTVRLEIEKDGRWTEVSSTELNPSGFTAPFRIDNWNDNTNVPYRVVYDLKTANGNTPPHAWYGMVKKNPIDKDEIVLAAFTGNHNVRHGGVDRGLFEWTIEGCWFPHDELVDHVFKHDPDVLFFSGDQVYEGASPTRAEIKPLDYLYKWYLWCWAFRDLAKDRPCICIPDDHDVYQGNLWGAGGRKAVRQDDGGYTRPPEFVNMIQRTQTSHLPDPPDPTPVGQGIDVYYCTMNYGPISFAIIEDRKFKSSATVMVPQGQVVNGWFQNPDFDPAKKADVAGATLLGQRQLDFLHDWSGDWSQGAQMKAVLSQTLFSNVATLPKEGTSNGVLPQTRIMGPDEYPEDWKLAADADSNAWPQTGRNRALREMRRGFAAHIAGDQHLGSTIQYGIDDWGDGPFALCVPSIANFWPRRWYPPKPGRNRKPGMPRYTGDYLDGFGNRMTVYAVSNPTITGQKRSNLYDRAPGFGIAKFDTANRSITLECWPRWEDPSKQDAQHYPGWPITITQADNYGRKAKAYLPTIQVRGLADPVIQVIDERSNETIYTLCIKGDAFRPKVFESGTYTIKVGAPDSKGMKLLKGVQSLHPDQQQTIEVSFQDE